jgi:hypothetical protein
MQRCRYHLIRKNEKVSQNVMESVVEAGSPQEAKSLDTVEEGDDDAGSDMGDGDDLAGSADWAGGGRPTKKPATSTTAHSAVIDVDIEGEDDNADLNTINIVKGIETLYTDASKFEGAARDDAKRVIMVFYSKLAQASTSLPMSGARLHRLLRNLRNIEAESALGTAGYHATIGVLHLNGEYTEEAPAALHESVNTKANNLANVIPYTGKVSDGTCCPS